MASNITVIPNRNMSMTNITVDSTYTIDRAYSNADSTRFARLNVTPGTTGVIYFLFDLSSLPTDIVIQNVTARFKARTNSTTRIYDTSVQLCKGTTPVGTAVGFDSTTATTYDMTDCGTWSLAELQSALRMRVEATADTGGSVHRFDFFGADITIEYITSGYAKVIQATELAVQIANDPTHGYNQHDRYGTPDFDCSSLVSYCLQQAGFNIDPHGTWTGNIGDKLSALGFTNVANLVNLQTGEGLEYGDIVLTVRKHHVEFSLGYDDGNMVVEAVHDEYNSKGSDRTQPGDQTGDEIRVRRFYAWDWQYIYRWIDGSGGGGGTVTPSFVIKFKELRRGARYAVISPVQSLLQDLYNINTGGVDGIFGEKTEKAVKEFQKQNGLTVDGIVGENTMKGLLQVNEDDD